LSRLVRLRQSPSTTTGSHMPVVALAALVAAAPIAPALAQGPTATPAAARTGLRAHEIDRAHSEINFTASSRLLDAHGFFDKWEAEVALNPDALETSTVRLVIDASSINTRIERRDTHLKSPDFFDVAKYPTITFVSKSITKTSATAGTLTGDLTLRGVTKTIAIPVSMVFYEGGRGRFRGQFQIDRKDYGISYDSKVNPIADTVDVQFNMSLAEKKG
jgi:polyisoprenoid-binding protein YceI